MNRFVLALAALLMVAFFSARNAEAGLFRDRFVATGGCANGDCAAVVVRPAVIPVIPALPLAVLPAKVGACGQAAVVPPPAACQPACSPAFQTWRLTRRHILPWRR